MLVDPWCVRVWSRNRCGCGNALHWCMEVLQHGRHRVDFSKTIISASCAESKSQSNYHVVHCFFQRGVGIRAWCAHQRERDIACELCEVYESNKSWSEYWSKEGLPGTRSLMGGAKSWLLYAHSPLPQLNPSLALDWIGMWTLCDCKALSELNFQVKICNQDLTFTLWCKI